MKRQNFDVSVRDRDNFKKVFGPLVRTQQTPKLQNLVVKQQKSTSNIGNNRNVTTEPNLGGTQLKRWVKNLSKYELSDAQAKVLSHGLG